MNKNIPNYITIFRLFLVIPFVIIFITPLILNIRIFPTYSIFDTQLICIITAGVIFVIAMITDYLDGYLARKYSAVSTFGKFFDPIADKFMTNSALIIMAAYNIIPIWIVVIIILRDVLVDGLRMFASDKKIVISASSLAKWKTFILSISIIILFFFTPLISNSDIYKNGIYIWIVNIPLIISLGLSLISGYNYFIKTKIH